MKSHSRKEKSCPAFGSSKELNFSLFRVVFTLFERFCLLRMIITLYESELFTCLHLESISPDINCALTPRRPQRTTESPADTPTEPSPQCSCACCTAASHSTGYRSPCLAWIYSQWRPHSPCARCCTPHFGSPWSGSRTTHPRCCGWSEMRRLK